MDRRPVPKLVEDDEIGVGDALPHWPNGVPPRPELPLEDWHVAPSGNDLPLL
jgi:hypothetical protein